MHFHWINWPFRHAYANRSDGSQITAICGKSNYNLKLQWFPSGRTQSRALLKIMQNADAVCSVFEGWIHSTFYILQNLLYIYILHFLQPAKKYPNYILHSTFRRSDKFSELPVHSTFRRSRYIFHFFYIVHFSTFAQFCQYILLTTLSIFTRLFYQIPPDLKNFLIGYIKKSPSGRRFACKIGVFFQISRILHTHFTFFVNLQKVQNTCTSRISWSWVLALHLHSTFFGDSDCMITSTFCILHMRVRARCLHSASTANSWKRRPTSIYIQCTESEQNSSGCIYIQHFGTPKHTPGFGRYILHDTFRFLWSPDGSILMIWDVRKEFRILPFSP